MDITFPGGCPGVSTPMGPRGAGVQDLHPQRRQGSWQASGAVGMRCLHVLEGKDQRERCGSDEDFLGSIIFM